MRVLPIALLMAGLMSPMVPAQAQTRPYDDDLLALPEASSLREWHTQLASEPHRAGTEGDARQIDRIAKAFEEMGLEVEVQEFWTYLSEPVSASLTILGDAPIELPLREKPLEEDEFSQLPELSFGWNAYSGSGTVEGRVVYVNRGTKEDFAHLRELGVDCDGAVVIARYGGNFRGYKAKFAEEAGAAALVIFTDPADAGYAKGLMYPEGGWANETTIQRGSIKTLPYEGDPLTPFVEATEDAERLDPDDLALPRIPVQPIGWGAAQEILGRMTGMAVDERSWQGGLPFAYRITGGADLRVRVSVEQRRGIVKSANVIGTLVGSESPEQRVIVGCHHDAWEYGAEDPTSGLNVVLEAARVLSAMRDAGWRPSRSMSFAAWGAEEYGIIGSTEWVEKHADELMHNAVAYFNLDAAVSGDRFGASASPTLKPLLMEVTRRVEDVRSDDEDVSRGENVFARWIEESPNEETPGIPRMGTLGGGSDHVGLYCYLGVPSMNLGFGGAQGNAYHSNYDNLAWYRHVVGDEYESARTLTQIVSLMMARLADDPIIPLESTRIGSDLSMFLRVLSEKAEEDGLWLHSESVLASIAALLVQADRTTKRLDAMGESIPSETREVINTSIVSLERVWLDMEGLPGRPWYRNTFASTDPESGYASWALPAVRAAIEAGDQEELDGAVDSLRSRVEALRAGLRAIELLCGPEK